MSVKRYIKKIVSESPFAIYNAIETLDSQRLDYLLKNTLTKNISGDAYFFMIDSQDDIAIEHRIACARILLKYYSEPIHNSCTINEIKRIEKKKNMDRINILLLCVKHKGYYNSMNSDICEIIYTFL